jgi:hypothetical protein
MKARAIKKIDIEYMRAVLENIGRFMKEHNIKVVGRNEY